MNENTHKRYSQKLNQRQGFTIVELLIVVIVIAVLAAIAIVSYNGIRVRAIESVMLNDLRTASSTLELDGTKNGSYPASIVDANDGQGIRSSGLNTFFYTRQTSSYCISVTNPQSPKSFILRSNTGTIIEGSCDATVTTLAGSGTQGQVNGTGTAAQFGWLTAIAQDASGNIFVADGSMIRRITPSGVVSTFAGSSTDGYTNGTGTAARFSSRIGGLAVNSSGTVYVADTYNNRIRQITPSGVVSLLAGSGVAGSTNGTAASAQFNNPGGLSFDTAGNLLVADTLGHQIRRVTLTGITTTVAGTGTPGLVNGAAASAQFNYPGSVVSDNDGTLYIADSSNNLIRRISTANVVTTYAGYTTSSGCADGAALVTARFNYPTGIVIDASRNLYVSNTNCHRIVKIDTSGNVTTVAGSRSPTSESGSSDGYGTTARFNSPTDLTVNNDGTVLYIADYANYKIRKIEL